jgi:hypothetical protein
MFDPHEDETSPLARLQDAVWQAPARLGGCPIWLREPVDPRDLPPAMPPAPRAGLPGLDAFIMQFDRRFVDVDLGAHGVMYVAGTGAYFQAYEQAAASAACS